jgi:hypothetical protein
MLRIESIRIVHECDTDPDTSYIGEYTDTPSPWAICRRCGEYLAQCGDDHEIPDKGREYRFFLPYAGGEEAGTPDYIKNGKQDYERMESLNRQEWYYIGIKAVAKLIVSGVCQTIVANGLYGIESDSDTSYFTEVEKEELAQLTEQLTALGVSPRAIRKAMENVERKER